MSTDPRPFALVLALALGGATLAGAAPGTEQVPPAPPAPPVPPVPIEAGEPGDPLDAPEEGEPETQRRFSLRLDAGAGIDQGIPSGEAEIDDEVYVVGADLLVGGSFGERTLILLGYAPELERFAEHDELEAVNHAAGVAFGHHVTRRLRIDAGGSLLDGEDPGRFLGGVLLVLPRTPYRQVVGRAGVEYRWRATALRLDLSRTETTIEPAEGLLAQGVDQTEDAATLTLERTLTERIALSASFSHLRPESEAVATAGAALEPLDEPIDVLTLTLRGRPTDGLTLLVSAGALDDGEEIDYVAAAELERRFGRSAVRLRYDRSLAGLGARPSGPEPGPAPPAGTGSAALADVLSDSVGLGLDLAIGERVVWEQSAWASRTTFPGSERLESVAVEARIRVRAVRNLGFYGALDWLDQKGGAAPRVTRTRATVGLVLGLAGVPDGRGVLEAPEGRAGVMPGSWER